MIIFVIRIILAEYRKNAHVHRYLSNCSHRLQTAMNLKKFDISLNLKAHYLRTLATLSIDANFYFFNQHRPT